MVREGFRHRDGEGAGRRKVGPGSVVGRPGVDDGPVPGSVGRRRGGDENSRKRGTGKTPDPLPSVPRRLLYFNKTSNVTPKPGLPKKGKKKSSKVQFTFEHRGQCSYRFKRANKRQNVSRCVSSHLEFAGTSRGVTPPNSPRDPSLALLST